MTESGRNWVFTHNNYTDEHEKHIQNIDCRFIFYGHEIAPTTGTPHLQGFICFWTTMRKAGVKKLFPKETHFELMEGRVSDSLIYCSKEGRDIFQKGDCPGNGSAALKGEAYWRDISEKLKDKRFDELPKSYTEGRYELYKKRRAEIEINDLAELKELDNYWIYGASGTGKSRYVRETYGNSLYIKRNTKWWDNYKGEETVLIEDLDPSHSYMLYDLKIWADRYIFPAEIKGGQVSIRPKRIIITSNYEIKEVFRVARDEELDPLYRRFIIKKF